ncbi:MAG: bifunctional heptose 7-phosphate kinase/heptose 1-phosphate adenyltransferase [SAR324 cluster bacterium]|nr:bifunctional heptose 7-phosphate kinase/heptose 1-phosphate adenyltransferase [SAR324 cluster bacterium]
MFTKQELQTALEQVKSPHILVIGDLMLDRYTWGNVSRISPEAPIPVLRVRREENRLGGAANAMCNLVALGAKVTACGVLGQDSDAEIVRGLFRENKIENDGVFQQKNLTTILKHRMIAGSHHLLRMDFDPSADWEMTQETQIIEFLKKNIPSVELILVSDYGKGVLTPNILETIRSLAKKHEIPTIVDPKKNADYQIYRDFTLIKPNRREIAAAVERPIPDVESACRAAEQIQKKFNFKYVTVSLDRDGLLLYQNPLKYTHFESEAQEVFDVVGAGDMVISVLAFLMAGNIQIEHAATWANLAAGMEIMHVGVTSFTKSDLLQKLDLGLGSNKVTSLDILLTYLKQQTLPVVFTNGYFDNISAAHLKFLQQMQQFKGVRVVAINSDRSIEKQKGLPPVLNEKERASILASIEVIDWVIVFDELNANHLIQKLKPSIVVKGEPHQQQQLAEQEVIDAVGAAVHYLPEYH